MCACVCVCVHVCACECIYIYVCVRACVRASFSIETTRAAISFAPPPHSRTHHASQLEYPTYEHREAALDCLLQLSRLPSFWPDLYLNYDCHLFCPDVCAALVALLGQHAFPEEQRLLTTHVTALDALLSLAQEIEARPDPSPFATSAADAQSEPATPVSITMSGEAARKLPPPGTLASVRDRKRLLLEGVWVAYK
jgi:hypothetical protein